LKLLLNEHAGWNRPLTEIEIFNDAGGKPLLKILPAIAENSDIVSDYKLKFSLSHSKEYAAAMLVIN
jgi:phosphopantetheinyl transferase (holo-ACP synthase)